MFFRRGNAGCPNAWQRKEAVGCRLAVAVLLFFVASSGEAATWWTVTNGNDSGAGSLRDILAVAVAGDTVAFSASVPEVTLNDYLFLNKALTIKGPVTIRQTVTGKRVLYITGDCTLEDLTITGGSLSQGNGAGVFNHSALTMNRCTVTNNTGGGGIHNSKTLTMTDCTISSNSATGSGKAGGINNMGSGGAPALTMTRCVVEKNLCSQGNAGGVYIGIDGQLFMARCTVKSNRNSGLGGGLSLGYGSSTYLTDHCVVSENVPDQICRSSRITFTADHSCTIGTNPNQTTTVFDGYSNPAEPTPRSIGGDADVAAVSRDLADPKSALSAAITEMLSNDLGHAPGGASAVLSGMTASLHYANTFENVAISSLDLAVEYTASWPERVRYYALFARADGLGYAIPERGVKFEIKAGQPLPDGVTPPRFYVPGEGLMTWRNLITDGGSFDLNPTPGVVTFRVCSVRAAAPHSPGKESGGCDAGMSGFAPLALLLGTPLLTIVRSRGKGR